MVEPEDCVWGKEFFDTYMRHAKKTSYKNEALHRVAALSLIGQAVRNVRLRADQTFIDCRIHPFIIQSSGTGKNSAFNLMGTVSEAAGFKFAEHGKDSTAGIMGTVQRNGQVQKGDLAGNGFVAWKEAQQLIKASQSDHSSDLLEVINQALDPSGNVSRALSGGKLEYNSRTSLFCTTYTPKPSGQLELIHQGFLPRTIFLYRRMDEDFYDYVNNRRDDNLPRPDEDNSSYVKSYEDDIERLANTLRYIEDTVFRYGDVYRGEDSHYAKGQEHIDYFEGVEKGVSINPSPLLDELLQEYPFRVRETARPFKTRMFDTTYKIAACLAAVDKDTDEEGNTYYVSRIIRERHADLAKKMVKMSFNHILKFIEDYMNNKGDKDLIEIENTIKKICMNDSGYATLREVMVETNQRKTIVKKYISTLDEMNKIKTCGTPANALGPDDKITLDTESEITRY